VDNLEEPPGLYYFDKGTMELYNTMWKTIGYVNLKEEVLEKDSLGSYINHVCRLCNTVELKKWTGFSQFRELTFRRRNFILNFSTPVYKM
jgi:hypothetical protein